MFTSDAGYSIPPSIPTGLRPERFLKKLAGRCQYWALGLSLSSLFSASDVLKARDKLTREARMALAGALQRPRWGKVQRVNERARVATGHGCCATRVQLVTKTI
jgi:hypothetical protein